MEVAAGIMVTVNSPRCTPVERPCKLACTLTVAGCVALMVPEVGVAVSQFVVPSLLKALTRYDSAFGDGLVTDIDLAAGFVPPTLPTKIKPVGFTKAPGLFAGDTTCNTTDANCGELTALDAENSTFP